MGDPDSEDFTWKIELETALFEEAEIGTLRNIAKGRPVPPHLRLDFWKACLFSRSNKAEQEVVFSDLFDLAEQEALRSDCQDLVARLGNEEEDQISVTSDLESLFTQFCKNRKVRYESSLMWMQLVQPLIALRLEKKDIYTVFEALQTKYIPRSCSADGAAPHLLRLLVLYHDPELCSFLDSKKVSTDLYAGAWFRTLFASCCNVDVVFAMWDVYFQANDPFLVFFLALVILINGRDQVIQMKESSTQEIAETLAQFPCALEAEDIHDFCSLAQYYITRTPQSYRHDYQSVLFGAGVSRSSSSSNLETGSDADSGCDVGASGSTPSHAPTWRTQSLCLSVSVPELLQAAHADTADAVRFFVVDCRSPDRYNLGHLATAFHLDASLMLQDPKEFNTAVNVLFSAQKQAISAGSRAAGEHLCFMGSGILDDDQEYNMVVANFLQKNTLFVSVVQGGWEAVVKFLTDARSPRLISTHTVGALHSALDAVSSQNPDVPADGADSPTSGVKSNAAGDAAAEFFGFKRGIGLINKLASPTTGTQLKEKLNEMKTKLTDYITNAELMASGAEEERHITPSPGGKRYRNTANVFSIDGDEDDDDVAGGASSGGGGSSEDEGARETVSLETWLSKPDVVHSFKCEQVKPNGYTHPSHILITATHLYVLREIPFRKGFAIIQSRRHLGTVVKITSRKKIPELITFKFTPPTPKEGEAEEQLISERFLIPQAGEATKAVKLQIIDVLKMQEEAAAEMGGAGNSPGATPAT